MRSREERHAKPVCSAAILSKRIDGAPIVAVLGGARQTLNDDRGALNHRPTINAMCIGLRIWTTYGPWTIYEAG